MKSPTTCALALVAVTASAAVASQAVAQANASHAHIGHVADSWGDTPDGMGLLPTAKAEADIAATHARLAVNASDLAGIQQHIGHVIHTIDPETAEGGPGKGYGMVKAAQGAVRHIRLAADAEGASDNVKLHATHVAASASNVAEWGLVVVERGRAIQETDDLEHAKALAEEVQALLAKILAGYDEDGDGRVSWGPSEGGLEQAAFHLDLMKQGEGLSG